MQTVRVDPHPRPSNCRCVCAKPDPNGLGHTFPGQLSNLSDPPLDLRTAGNIAKHLSQLLGPHAGERGVGLDSGIVELILSGDADATDDCEIVGFVVSRR